MSKFLDNPLAVIGSLVAVFVALIMVPVLDVGFGTKELITCRVVEKIYKPATNVTGIINTVGPDGKMRIGTMNNSTAEEYILIVDRGNSVVSKSVRAELWAKAIKDQYLNIEFTKGWLTGYWW